MDTTILIDVNADYVSKQAIRRALDDLKEGWAYVLNVGSKYCIVRSLQEDSEPISGRRVVVRTREALAEYLWKTQLLPFEGTS